MRVQWSDWDNIYEKAVANSDEALRRHQGFSGAGIPPGRRQFIAHRLIHMGDRHDSVVASIEETGSAWNNRMQHSSAKKNPPSENGRRGKCSRLTTAG